MNAPDTGNVRARLEAKLRRFSAPVMLDEIEANARLALAQLGYDPDGPRQDPGEYRSFQAIMQEAMARRNQARVVGDADAERRAEADIQRAVDDYNAGQQRPLEYWDAHSILMHVRACRDALARGDGESVLINAVLIGAIDSRRILREYQPLREQTERRRAGAKKARAIANGTDAEREQRRQRWAAIYHEIKASRYGAMLSEKALWTEVSRRSGIVNPATGRPFAGRRVWENIRSIVRASGDAST